MNPIPTSKNTITTSNNNLGVVMRWSENIATNGNIQQFSVVNDSIYFGGTEFYASQA